MKAVLVLITCLSIVHCTTLRKEDAVTLELKGKPGDAYETRYYSNSRMMAYSEGQLLRDRTDAVDFTVRTEIKSYDPTTKLLKFKVKTVRKDGKVPLHDLAFPELKQEIDYVVDGGTSAVLQAGTYDKQSLFFVPSIPMPKGPVSVGDTWTLNTRGTRRKRTNL